MLCQVCENMFRGNFLLEKGRHLRSHHYAPDELQAAALEGCSICDVLWRRYQFRKPSGSRQEPCGATFDSRGDSLSNFAVYEFYPASESSVIRLGVFLNIKFEYGAELDHSQSTSSSCSFYLRSTSELDDIDKRAVMRAHEAPKPSMVVAKQWLEICSQSHAQCNSIRAWRSNLQLPARLLEIGAPAFDRVRLWSAPAKAGSISLVSYMTLSHCWGSAQFITLTKSTLSRLKAGILISDLPQTFQDAVYITRTMEVKYLWIDSLCILQDSISDWQHEASLMGDVYRGSFCNIAATSASDASVGCLYPKSSSPRPCVVQTSWSDVPNNEYLVQDLDFWAGVFESDPLRRRAWVVQELLLSPRILHMGKSQVSWECCESKVCEAFPDRLPRFVHIDAESVPIEAMSTLSWRSIIQTYTSCNLTKPEDKLVAISGVVKIMQTTTGDEYCAGLWRKNLPEQLLWRRAYNQHTPLIPVQVFRAPSWSWASVDGRVKCESSNSAGVIKVNILNVDIQASCNDLTGSVTGGRIKLSGPMNTIQLEELVGPGMIEHYDVAFDECHSETTQICRTWNAPPENLHCLGVRKVFRRNYTSYDCLLLIPTKANRGEFYRWGYVYLGHRMAEAFENAETHDWLEYEAHDGKGNYTISII
ncbi:uncharacterized protein PAC_18620 [Phialocephala subalpina]|uniref:Heterokaryon incompatibility domain-containing protein n=1 Tax=Phialocephala subalpina TaxID=576137 RepID=A0A1L7XUM8_9HELO|nr:uncharacterized protein PAC_18620 [Phialocephala subalpina]